jgi:hypothetical protein
MPANLFVSVAFLSKVPGQCVEIRFLLYTFYFRQLLRNFLKKNLASLCWRLCASMLIFISKQFQVNLNSILVKLQQLAQVNQCFNRPTETSTIT